MILVVNLRDRSGRGYLRANVTLCTFLRSCCNEAIAKFLQRFKDCITFLPLWLLLLFELFPTMTLNRLKYPHNKVYIVRQVQRTKARRC